MSCGAFTPDGKLVLTGGGENDASLRYTEEVHAGAYARLPDEQHLLVIRFGPVIDLPSQPIPFLPRLRVWDPKTGECKVTVQGHPFHEGGLTSLDIHPDSTVVLTGSEDGTAKVVNIQTGREAVQIEVQCLVQGRQSLQY